jgi:aminopeptidase
VNGVIRYNVPTTYRGRNFDDVRLVFREGRIVEATASDTPAVNAIFDADPGARYIGEFSFGLNPCIARPMRDILFDEKIAGSIHLTPGNAYERADNGTRSQIHWDLILIQTAEYGGGEIRIDGELIRRDGRFVPADLQGLNPEALTAP